MERRGATSAASESSLETVELSFVTTSKQLILDALQGRPTPHVPTGPLAVHYCARFAGASLKEYTTSAQRMADSILRYYERFRPDAVWLSADTWVSAEAMGARVGAATEDQPFGGVGMPLIRTPQDIDRLPNPDPGVQGRYPLMLEALERLVTALGRDVCVVACFDQYPFSLASALMGLQETMFRVVDDPSFVEALMERCLEYGLAYGRALAAAGADVLSGGDSPAGLLGPQGYRERAWRFERRLIAGLKEATGRPVSLHICGDARPLLADMVLTGADVVEVDQRVDLVEACRIVGPGVALWGNLDPVAVLAQGTVANVEASTRRALEAVAACRHPRFVLSSGCTLAVETPPENLEAMIRVARGMS